MRGEPASAAEAGRAAGAWLLAAVVVLLLSGAGAWFFTSRGYTLYFGDAEAHLNIARRILDSRTPGAEQIGTVWLPLPHLLMLPPAMRMSLWQSGFAGSLVGMAAFAAAALLLFGAARRAFRNSAAGFCALFLLAANPNLLYLQATPMTEPLVLASLCGLLYATVCFGETRSWMSLLAAALFANLGALSRYEGWFVLPFVAAFVLLRGGKVRWSRFAVFCLLGGIAPLAWLAHNLWYYANPLEFYSGPYSAKAIYQRALDAGMARYPGDHDWLKAGLYYGTAAQLCARWGLVGAGVAGAAVALVRRVWWPLIFLSLPPLFYVLSLYSSGTPIFVPNLWPSSWYNTRYGVAALPFFAFAGAAIAAAAPARFRTATAGLIVAASLLPWMAYPGLDGIVCWKESQVNSADRREWTAAAAEVLRRNYRPGSGILSSFGDQAGIFRSAGIPLAEVLHDGNGPAWYGAVARPDLFLHEEWVVALAGDPVSTAMLKTLKDGPAYERVKIINVGKAPTVEIFQRNEDPLHKGPRGQKRLSSDLGR